MANHYMASCLVAIILAVFFVKEGTSIRCYVCATDANRNCADPFNHTRETQHLLIDCDRDRTNALYFKEQSVSYCKKVKRMINDRDDMIIRSCVWAHNRDEDPCNPNANPYHNSASKVQCSVCEEDMCNGANEIYAKTVLIFALAIVASKILF